MKHKHEYLAGKSRTVVVCDCGKFKFTKYGLKTLPQVVETKENPVNFNGYSIGHLQSNHLGPNGVGR